MKSALLKTVATLCVVGSILAQAVALKAQELPSLPKAIKDAGIIRIGVKCDSPPFGSTGPDGKPLGIEVEMAKQISVSAFGSPDKAELICLTTDARIPSLTGGKIDLILATLGKTAARAEVIDFSDPYFWGSSNVIVPKSSPVQKLADLNGKAVIAVKGGSQAKWFRENLPNTDIMQLNSVSDNVQALLQGRADGYAADGGVIATLSGTYPDLRVLEEGFDPGANSVGMRKNEPELKAFVNAVLQKMKADKFYAKLAKKYIESPTLLATMLKGFETDPPAAALNK